MSFFSSLFKHSPHALLTKAAKKTLPIVLTGGIAGVAAHAVVKNFRGGKKTEQDGISMGQLEASKRVEPIAIEGSTARPTMRIQPIKVNPEAPRSALSGSPSAPSTGAVGFSGGHETASTSGSPRLQIMPVLRSPSSTISNRVPVQREYPSGSSDAGQAATSQ